MHRMHYRNIKESVREHKWIEYWILSMRPLKCIARSFWTILRYLNRWEFIWWCIFYCTNAYILAVAWMMVLLLLLLLFVVIIESRISPLMAWCQQRVSSQASQHHTVGLFTNALYFNTSASGTECYWRCECVRSLVRWREPVVGIGPDRFNVICLYDVQCTMFNSRCF